MEFQHVSFKRLIVDELVLWGAAAAVAVVLLLLMDADFWLLQVLMAALMIAVLLGSLVYLPLLWRNAGWKYTPRILYLRRGVFLQRKYEVPLQQIVGVMLVQNPLTPVLKLASLIVVCPGFQIRVRGMDIAEAKWLVKKVSPRSRV